MVYKYYIKRGSKRFGPYYYRSYRVGNKVKKEYLGKNNRKRVGARNPLRIIRDTVRKMRLNGAKPS
jgi:hypothetical protein